MEKSNSWNETFFKKNNSNVKSYFSTILLTLPSFNPNCHRRRDCIRHICRRGRRGRRRRRIRQ